MTVYMEVDETVNEKVFSIHGRTTGGELLNMQSTARFGGEDECYLMLNKQVLGLRRWNKQDFRSKIFFQLKTLRALGSTYEVVR